MTKTILTDSELHTLMGQMHEQIQSQREAISDDEPPIGHPKKELWNNLLKAEYYCLMAEQVLGTLLDKEGK